MSKTLKSGVSIIFKIIGYPCLAAGLFGFYLLFFSPDAEFKLYVFIQCAILTFISLFAVGYKSYIKINSHSAILFKQIFNFIVKSLEYKISEFDSIFIDIREPITEIEASKQDPYYGISFRGQGNSLDLTTNIGKTLTLLNKKNWKLVSELTEELATITGLKVIYSEEVRSYNNIN